MDDHTMIITLPDGEEKLMYIRLTFHVDEFNKDYVVFYDPQDEEAGDFCMSYDGTTLSDIETEEERELGDEVYGALMDDDE